jgi:hypothetical protein
MVALVLEQDSEVVQGRGDVRMIGAKHLLLDRQCTFVERPRPCSVSGASSASI